MRTLTMLSGTLRRLCLHGAYAVTDRSMMYLSSLKHLEMLTLYWNDQDHCLRAGLRVLHQLTLLRRLNLTFHGNSASSIVDGLTSIAELGVSLVRLKLLKIDLSLDGCFALHNVHLTSLVHLPITALNLYSTSVTDEGLRHLSKLPLVHLNLGRCLMITDDGLQYLQMSSLSSLVLGFTGDQYEAGRTALPVWTIYSPTLLDDGKYDMNLLVTMTFVTEAGLKHLHNLKQLNNKSASSSASRLYVRELASRLSYVGIG